MTRKAGSTSPDISAKAEAPLQADPDAKPAEAPAPGKIDINFSAGLASFLAENDIALAFTSYQTGFL